MIKDYSGLSIRKGGKLIEHYWHEDKGDYQERDVTESAIQRIFESCILEEDVTLKDIFLLLNTELDIFHAIIGNWCDELVTEGLTKPATVYSGYDKDEIEYLELYQTIYTEPEGTYGLIRPDFHGVGWELKEDYMAGWTDSDGKEVIDWPKGERIPWGLSCHSTNELINVPIKLKNEMTIYDDNPKTKNYGNKITSYPNCEFSLGHIFYGIIWELSFYGAPSARKALHGEIDDASKKIKE